MPSSEVIIRWLDLLIEQTEYGNINWQKVWDEEGFEWVGSDSRVALVTRDGDGELPYILAIGPIGAEPSQTWIIYHQDVPESLTEAAPEYVASRARKLWTVINEKKAVDAVSSMLADLEQLPPF